MAFREAVGTSEAVAEENNDGEPVPEAPPLPLTPGVLLLMREKLLTGESDKSPEPVGDKVGLCEGVSLLVELAVP